MSNVIAIFLYDEYIYSVLYILYACRIMDFTWIILKSSHSLIIISFFFRFGVEHDGLNNNCSDIDGYLMSPIFAASLNKFHWSECSKQQMSKFL